MLSVVVDFVLANADCGSLGVLLLGHVVARFARVI